MRFSDWIRNLRLPISVIGGPILWALQLGIGYVLVPVACQKRANWLMLVVGVIAALPVLGMGVIAYQGWRRYSTTTQQIDVINLDEPEGLGEFFGSAGTIVSSLFLLLIVATAIYSFFLSPCPVITMSFP